MNQQQAMMGVQPATKDDLRESEARTNARIDELRDDMNRQNAGLRDDMNRQNAGLRADMEAIRKDLKADMRMFFGGVVGLFGVFASAMLGILVVAL